MGYPYFTYMLAPLLSTKDIQFQPLDEGERRLVWLLPVIQSDVCYFIGVKYLNTHLLTLCRLLHKPVVMHWVGTDVTSAIEVFNKNGHLPRYIVEDCIHWAEVNWIAKELSSIQINAEIVPLPVMLSVAPVSPLPQTFTILAYLPDTRPTFYGAHHILRLAKEMPDIRVMCVGFKKSPFHFTDEPLPPNIELFGRLESLDQVYKDTTVLVRITEHDGLSFMVLEALEHGRYCVWSHSLDKAPGVFVAMNYETLHEHIHVLYDKHARGCLLPNYEGAEFIRRQYAPERMAGEIRHRFELLRQR